MTIARKLWLGLGVLILIFLVADLSILELDAVLKRWTSLLGRLEKEFGRVRPALEAEAARDS
jgi:hypothetical protein